MEKKYKEFAYKEQSKRILDIIDEYISINNLSGSFTNCFRDSYLDEEVDNLLKIFIEKGINFQNFFNNFRDLILADFHFYGEGVFTDLLLYRFEKSYPIGGLSLNEMEEDEKVIKYAYGYYKYNLGKKFILQSFNTLEDFYFSVAKDFIYNMLSGYEISSKFQTSIKHFLEKNEASEIQNLCTIAEKRKDHSILIVNLYLFKKLLRYFDVIVERGESDAIDNLEFDLNQFEIEFWFDNVNKKDRLKYPNANSDIGNSEFLLCAFGPNNIKEKVSENNKKKFKEDEEKVDMMSNMKKYNL